MKKKRILEFRLITAGVVHESTFELLEWGIQRLNCSKFICMFIPSKAGL